MKKILFVLLIAAVFGVTFPIYAQHEGHQTQGTQKEQTKSKKPSSKKTVYYCPMHPGFTSDKPGDCAICGMKLVKLEEAKAIERKTKTPQEICILHNCKMTNCPMQITGDVKDCPFCGAHLAKGKKILYYRSPMDPKVTSAVAMKDQMGMDYVPVYEEEIPASESGFYISPEKQQLIGVKTEKVIFRPMIKAIRTVGRVAFDPELYKAQTEYIAAIKTLEKVRESGQAEIVTRAQALVDAGSLKLELSGLSPEQIEKLAVKKENDESLLISSTDSSVTWVYATIYEYELEAIKIGQEALITAVSYPDRQFFGKIVAVDPVFDTATRSVRARIQVDNQGGLLKPNMYVDVQMSSDSGIHLALPKEAIMDSGLRKIVFVSLPDGYIQSREVKTGVSSEEYVQVIEGVKEGENVVVSGNFLIDSESKLKAALEGTGHQHGQ